MYLEISGRQSGKTTRLIDFAISRARKGESVCIVVCRQHMVSCITNIIENKTINDHVIVRYDKFIYKAVATKSFITITTSLRGCSRYDWVCYDEFDFNPNICLEDIQQNSYFVTSPKSLRKVEERTNSNKRDILYQLILKKRGKYHCHINGDLLTPGCVSIPVNEKYGVWKVDKNGNWMFPKTCTALFTAK
jgi:hypothetical protein